MTTLAVATDGLPIYDAAGLPLFQTPTGGVVDAAGNAADINPANGLPRDATGNDIQQPNQLTRVNHLIAHATASTTAAAIASARSAQVVTAPAPVRATSVTFARVPGRVNRDIIDFTTKAGDALCKRATKPLWRWGRQVLPSGRRHVVVPGPRSVAGQKFWLGRLQHPNLGSWGHSHRRQTSYHGIWRKFRWTR
jgi:hypothetical protein